MIRKPFFITIILLLQINLYSHTSGLEVTITNLPSTDEIIYITQQTGIVFTGVFLTSLGTFYCMQEKQNKKNHRKLLLPIGCILTGLTFLFSHKIKEIHEKHF